MENKRLMWTSVGGLLGGGAMFGIAKACKANTGIVILLTVIGIGAGGFLGYVE